MSSGKSHLISTFYVGDRLVDFFRTANLGYGGTDIAERVEKKLPINRRETDPENIPQTHMDLLFKHNIATLRILKSLFTLYLRVNQSTRSNDALTILVDEHIRKYFGKGTNSKLTLFGEAIESKNPEDTNLSSLERLQIHYDKTQQHPFRSRNPLRLGHPKGLDSREIEIENQIPFDASRYIKGSSYLLEIIKHYLIQPYLVSEKLLSKLNSSSVEQAVKELHIYIMGTEHPVRLDDQTPSKGLLEFHGWPRSRPSRPSNPHASKILKESDSDSEDSDSDTPHSGKRSTKDQDIGRAELATDPVEEAYNLGVKAGMKTAMKLMAAMKAAMKLADE